jgi:hypothetical protein
MRMTLFLNIMHKISKISPYFSEKYDVTGHIDLTVLQKCTTDARQLTYSMAADMIDEYLKLGKSTAIKSVEYYCAGIIVCLGLSSYVVLLSLILNAY